MANRVRCHNGITGEHGRQVTDEHKKKNTFKRNTHSLSGLLYDMCPEIISVWITALVLKHSQYANKEADSVDMGQMKSTKVIVLQCTESNKHIITHLAYIHVALTSFRG